VAPIETRTPNSPGWWLVQLSNKLSARRLKIRRLRSYMDGSAPLPEGAEGLLEAYRTFQRKSRTNFGELVVEAVAERMIPTGVRVGDDDADADSQARRIWTANHLDIFAPDVHADMLGVGDGYVIVGPPAGGEGTPVITREAPELVVTAHDPRRPQKIIAAMKLFRDDVAGLDYAWLFLPGQVWVAKKKASEQGGDPEVTAHGWEWDEELSQSWPDGMGDALPVVRFRNRRGLGEFEPHTDVLDRINYMILQRLVIAAMQAYRQRATKGDLPEVDEEGNPIDYGALMRPGPGALWRLPEGVELWESQTTDMTPLLSAAKDDIRDLGAVTRTPMSMLLPDGANQTAEGAAFAREGLIFKTDDRIKRATYGWDSVYGWALRFSGSAAAVEQVRTLWAPPERYSLAERADASSKAADIPWRTRMTDIWGFAPESVDRMESERVSDQLMIAALAPVAPSGQESVPNVDEP